LELKEALGAIAAGIVLMVPAVKWLIKDWAKKAEEIEALKKVNTTNAMGRLEEEVKSFRATVSIITVTIHELKTSLAVNKAEVALLKEHLTSTIKSIDQYSKDLDSKIGTQIKSEIIELSKRVSLIRNKKNGQ